MATENRYDRITNRVVEKMREASDHMALQLKGGQHPMGATPVSRNEQLWEYRLLSAPLMSLPPDLQEEVLRRRERFAGRPETDIREWVYEMEKLQAQELRREVE